jgi:parvulin-like peptidyl-prolyl isomerase
MILLLWALIGLTGFKPAAAAEVLDKIYATVNDEVITSSDIDDYQKQLKGRLLYEDLLFADEEAVNAALKDRKILVDKLIGEKILDSEAKKLGINITEDQLNKEILQKGGEKHLSELLAQKHLTMREYKSFLKKSLARKQVVQAYVASRVKISDDDIMDFYAANTKGSGASQGFEFNLSHILFTFKGMKEKDEARTQASEALKMLAQGASFNRVHEKFNPKSKDDAFGVFKTGEMLPVIENAVVKLKSGETSQIVESPMGYHIFKLNGKKVVNNPDFEKRKQQLFQILFAKAYKEQLDYWLGQRRRTAIVKVSGDK